MYSNLFCYPLPELSKWFGKANIAGRNNFTKAIL